MAKRTTRKTTKKHKKVTKATRQKLKLMIGGGFVALLIVIILLAVLAFKSCGVDYENADMNTVYVLKNGKIVSTDIEAFDEKTYNSDKLEAYVDDVIDTYNKEHGEDSLKKKSYIVEENVATLVLEYANTDVYEAVNGVELFSGTIKEAKKAGYTFDCSFAKMVDGKAITATAEDFADGEDYQVLIIKSNTKVVLPGEVCFVSTQNISKVGEDYVVMKDGCQLLTEEPSTDTEFGTEAEGSDESISEDELVSGDGNIIFDFGEEEESTSQYSEVLTYIIYK